MNEEVTTFTQLRMLAERSRAYGTSLAVDITQALMDVAEVAGDAQDAADTAQQGVSDLKKQFQNLNDIKDFNLYWCLWSSGTEHPPQNDQITYAICGTAVCGLTICGLTEGEFWTTIQPHTVDNLYKWVKIYIEYEDETAKWLGPYCLTDNYTRDLANQLEANMADIRNQINDIVAEADDSITELNETIREISDSIQEVQATAQIAQSTAELAQSAANDAQSKADQAKSVAENSQSTAESALSTAEAAQSTASTAQDIAQEASSTASNAQSIAKQANDAASNAETIANTVQQEISELKQQIESLNGVKSITEYYCLWSKDTPPDDQELTPAICGDAVCGLTVCGVTDGQLWTTDEPEDEDDLYKWTKWKVIFEDDSIEWFGPLRVTDYYLREAYTTLQKQIENIHSIAEQTQTIATQANETAESAQSMVDNAYSIAVQAQSTAGSAAAAAESAQEAAEAATVRIDISDYVSIEDDVDGSLACAYAIGGFVFLQFVISNTSTNSIDIASIASPYRPPTAIYGFYSNMAMSYPNALLFARITRGGDISARFTMETANSYITYIYPIA